jgi:hypothetical protein
MYFNYFNVHGDERIRHFVLAVLVDRSPTREGGGS